MAERVIKVKVSAGSKIEKIEEIEPGVFKVRVQEAPEKGKANERVLALIAEYFKISKSQVFLKSGASYKEKIILLDL